MELYIPPPMPMLVRAPPRTVAPSVPVVPLPELPTEIHAPDGTYVLNPSLFPPTGTPSTVNIEYRPPPVTSPFMGNTTGQLPISMTQGQTALSAGTTVVNGQAQPSQPVRFSWATVYFPAKAGEKSFGRMLGMGAGSKSEAPGDMISESTESSSEDEDVQRLPPVAYDAQLSVLPQQSTGKRMTFGKSVPASLPRPKTSMRSNSSSFITSWRYGIDYAKLAAEKGKNGPEVVRWAFWNLGRTVGWGEEGTKAKVGCLHFLLMQGSLSSLQEPNLRVSFSAMPTCHAVSPHTTSPDRMDLIVGFATGDILWMDWIDMRYSRINKGVSVTCTLP